MENQDIVTKIPEEPLKKSDGKLQKIIAISLAVALVIGLGTFAVLELINRNNQSTSDNGQSTSGNNQITSEIIESTSGDDESADDYFASAPTYNLELKDGENSIKKPGVYTVTGSTSNGYIYINTDENKVKLILNGVTIKNSSGPAIYVESNENVHIETVGEITLEAVATEDLDATIYSKADLILKGDGTLNIISTIDGIHGKDDVKIKSGTINVTASEDGIKGKDSLVIQGGDITVSAGDDGLKVSNDEEEDKGILTISGGNITVKKSKEAIEAAQINIGGGNIDVTASDDGVNAAADFCSQMAMSPTGNSNITVCKITIAGGTLKVNAGGDGLDSNGSIYLSGGTVYVDGPTNSGNGALDYDGAFEITGGTIVATGMSGMAINASSATQGSALVNLSSTYPAGSTITIGNVSFTPTKSFNSVMVSSPNLEKGKSYDLKINGETAQTIEFSDFLVGSGNQGGPGGQPAQGSGNPQAQQSPRNPQI